MYSMPEEVRKFLDEQERIASDERRMKDEDDRLRREAERKVEQPKEEARTDWSGLSEEEYRNELFERFGSTMGL